MKNKITVGKTYSIKHSRFGEAVVKILDMYEGWADVLVVSGALVGLRHKWEAGDNTTILLSHAKFTPAK